MDLKPIREDVKKYLLLKNTPDNISLEIEELETLRSRTTTRYGEKIRGSSTNAVEEKIVSLTDKINLLKLNYEETQIFIRSMERALNQLLDEEKEIVIDMNSPSKLSNKELESKHYCTLRTLYRKENTALTKLYYIKTGLTPSNWN